MRLPGWMLAGVLLCLPAMAQDKVDPDKLKSGADLAANWLIDNYDYKTGVFAKSELSRMPGLQALILMNLLDHPRKYEITDGPFMTGPLEYILSSFWRNWARTSTRSNWRRPRNTS
jgi:hypothetical protein